MREREAVQQSILLVTPDSGSYCRSVQGGAEYHPCIIELELIPGYMSYMTRSVQLFGPPLHVSGPAALRGTSQSEILYRTVVRLTEEYSTAL